jgi:lipopolysaccharide transport system ATP-binding protein
MRCPRHSTPSARARALNEDPRALPTRIAIRFEHVSKHYKLGRPSSSGLKHMLLRLPELTREARAQPTVEVLRDVSFEIPQGQWTAIIGRNGTGKSTSLGLMAGVIAPSEGRVSTQGRISPLLELGAGFHHELTGAENILMNGVLLGFTRREVRARFDEIVEFSGLADAIERPVRTYSSGMVARLGFSVAVHVEADVLLIDEILTVGDEGFQRRCLEKMQKFHAAGVTIVLVSHALTMITKLCDRALLLEKGELLADGAPGPVVEKYYSQLQG